MTDNTMARRKYCVQSLKIRGCKTKNDRQYNGKKKKDKTLQRKL